MPSAQTISWRHGASPFLAMALVLLLVNNPVSGTSPMTTILSHPFKTAYPLARSHPHFGPNGTVNFVSSPFANTTSGQASMEVYAIQTHKGNSTVDPWAGFKFPLGSSLSGNHTFSASWSIHWHANATWRGFGHLDACVDSFLVDLTTATWVAFGTGMCFVSAPASPNAFSSSGFLNRTLTFTNTLNASHSYRFWTGVFVHLAVYHWSSGAASSAFFDLAAPYGATLNWVSIS
jgi:hypothetical protein